VLRGLPLKKIKQFQTTNFKLDGSDQLFRGAGNPSLFVW
jgi:hypothetical protein